MLVFADDELLLGVLFSVELDEGVVFVFVVVLLLVSVGVLFCSVFTVLCVEDEELFFSFEEGVLIFVVVFFELELFLFVLF